MDFTYFLGIIGGQTYESKSNNLEGSRKVSKIFK